MVSRSQRHLREFRGQDSSGSTSYPGPTGNNDIAALSATVDTDGGDSVTEVEFTVTGGTPGGEETLTVTVTLDAGSPVEAEVTPAPGTPLANVALSVANILAVSDELDLVVAGRTVTISLAAGATATEISDLAAVIS